jgi:hypothetical protein
MIHVWEVPNEAGHRSRVRAGCQAWGVAGQVWGSTDALDPLCWQSPWLPVLQGRLGLSAHHPQHHKRNKQYFHDSVILKILKVYFYNGIMIHSYFNVFVCVKTVMHLMYVHCRTVRKHRKHLIVLLRDSYLVHLGVHSETFIFMHAQYRQSPTYDGSVEDFAPLWWREAIGTL